MSLQDKINLLFTVIIFPLFGWVWHTNTQVSTLEIKLDRSTTDIAGMSENSTDIKLIKKDIHYMKQVLDRIDQKVQGNQ
jgi:hypothetical protein